ncbi:MAG: DUF2933 domain-containing protein [Pseudomonadota bacterium]
MVGELEKRYLSKGRLVFVGFLVFALLLLLTEHRAHFFGILPYLILLACPLMHLFMHHGNGGYDQHTHGHEPPKGEPK